MCLSYDTFPIKILLKLKKHVKTNNGKDQIYKSKVEEVITKVDKLFNKLNTRVLKTDVELLKNEMFQLTGNTDQVKLVNKLVLKLSYLFYQLSKDFSIKLSL